MLFFHKTLCFMEKASRKGAISDFNAEYFGGFHQPANNAPAPGYGGIRCDRDRDDWDDFCDRDD